MIVLDGKQPRHGGGHSGLTAVTVPSQHYLGSTLVDTKTNEIPVARGRFHFRVCNYVRVSRRGEKA